MAVDTDQRQPIRVVMFGSGPKLTSDAAEFLCRLEEHPEIEVVHAFCQAEASGLAGVVRDLWRRRGVLALPLFVAWAWGEVARFAAEPRAALERRRMLARLHDRLHFVKDIHAPEVLACVRDSGADLGLVYGSPILKPELFELPRLGTLGIHHGKLPEYRGQKSTFWAMYNGDDVTGVAIQRIGAGLDTGAIVKSATVTIGHRSLHAVLHELVVLGLVLYVEAIMEVKRGIATFRPQPGPRRRLYRNPRLRDLLTFWARRVRRRLP